MSNNTPALLSPATRDNTIIFIGPEGSGKSTVGKFIAPLLNTTLYSLDRHRDELYAPYNYSKQKADEIYAKEGLWTFYAYWNEFEYKTVCSLLKNEHPSDLKGKLWGQILDFGAGHSVYTDSSQLSTIQNLMAPFKNVFLFIPCEDIEEGIKITEERRGHKLELNRLFFEHESNRLLAKHVVYTKGRTPEECVEEVLGVLRGNGWEVPKAA